MSNLEQERSETKKDELNQPESSILQAQQQSKMYDKIEEMSKSLANATIISASKPIDSLKKIQQQQQSYCKEVTQNQKRILDDLNMMEKNLLVLDRSRLLSQANLKNMQEQLNQTVLNFGEYLRNKTQKNNQKLSQYGELISKTKIKMVQLENNRRQKAEKFILSTKQRLYTISKSLKSFDDNKQEQVKEQIKHEFKAIRGKIEEEGRLYEKQSKKTALILSEVRSNLYRKVEQEQNRQKECFQQNYRALEEIFKLLSEQIIDYN